MDQRPGRIQKRERGPWGALLFLAVFCYYWITITPFVDLTGAAAVDPSAGSSNALNQLISLALFGALILFWLVHRKDAPILEPRWLIVALLGWCLLTSLLAAHPDLALKRLFLVMVVGFNAAVMLLLPRSSRQFAMLAGLATALVVGLCYFGVIAMPRLAIHQADELREPMNAGLWRGLFTHKNTAAAAMVLAIFFSLYVAATWSRLLGFATALAAFFFLTHTGGKTSLMMVPAILLLAFTVEKWRWARVPIVVGGLVLFNLVAIGAAVSEPLRNLVVSLGVDPTFTDRSDIWRFAFSAIAERPLTGFGFQSFWQTEELVYSGGSVETWAVTAYNGHNAYLDTVLSIGLPGLVLTLLLLVAYPLGNLNRALAAGNDPALTRLYLRIWLYALFTSCVESVFYQGGGAMWFSLLVAVFGLRLQARAHLVTAPAKAGRAAYA